MLIIDRQASGSERVTRETAKALTRKNLDMDFGGAAIINDAASGERYEIARASRLSCLIAKGGVAVIRPVFLRPAHERCYPAAVDHRSDCRCRTGQVQGGLGRESCREGGGRDVWGW